MISAVGTRKQGDYCPLQIFDDTLTLFQSGGGQIIPTTLLLGTHGSKILTQALNETEKSEDTNNSLDSVNKTDGAINSP